MPPGEHHQNKLVKDVFIGDVEVMLEGGEVDPPICLRGVVSSTTSEPLKSGYHFPTSRPQKVYAGRRSTHIVFKIFLTGLEGVLAQLHADLGGGIVYEVPVSAEDIIAAPGSALLIGIPIGALLLLRLGRGRRWRRPQLGDGGNVLRDRMVERR